MKRKNKLLYLLSCICALTFAMGFVSCKNDAEGVSVPNATITDLNDLYLEKDSVQLNLGESYQIRLSKNEQATYKSENETVATVSSTGEVVAKSKGVTEIIVNTNEKTLKLFVVVYEKESTVNLSFERTEIEIVAGSSVYVSYTLDTEKELEDGIPTFATMDEEVATVQYVENQTVEIQAKDVGSTNIYGTVEGSLACLRVQVIEGKLMETTVDNAPSGYENAPVYVKSFDETTEFDGEYSSPAAHAVEIVTEEIGAPQEEGFTLWGRFDGFTQTEANLGLENRFAYGFIAVIYNSSNDYYQKKILLPHKIYAVEADDDGKFGVMLNDIPQADIGFYAFAEYAEDGEIKTIVSTERLLFGNDKVDVLDNLQIHTVHLHGAYTHIKQDVTTDGVVYTQTETQKEDANGETKTSKASIYFPQYDEDGKAFLKSRVAFDLSNLSLETLKRMQENGYSTLQVSFLVETDGAEAGGYTNVLVGVKENGEPQYQDKFYHYTNRWSTVEISTQAMIAAYGKLSANNSTSIPYPLFKIGATSSHFAYTVYFSEANFVERLDSFEGIMKLTINGEQQEMKSVQYLPQKGTYAYEFSLSVKNYERYYVGSVYFNGVTRTLNGLKGQFTFEQDGTYVFRFGSLDSNMPSFQYTVCFGDNIVAVGSAQDILTLHQGNGTNSLYYAEGIIWPDNLIISETNATITDKNSVGKQAIYQYLVDIETRGQKNYSKLYNRPVIGIDFAYTAEELAELKTQGFKKFTFTFMMKTDDEAGRQVRTLRILSGLDTNSEAFQLSNATYTEKAASMNEWITVEFDIETVISWLAYIDATGINLNEYQNNLSYTTEFFEAIKGIHSLIQMNNGTAGNAGLLVSNYTVYVAECAFMK